MSNHAIHRANLINAAVHDAAETASDPTKNAGEIEAKIAVVGILNAIDSAIVRDETAVLAGAFKARRTVEPSKENE